jgi:hypothetical protein
MASNKHEFKTAIFEDGTCAVLRADPTKPRLLEVIATFYDAAQAQDYVRFENNPSVEHREESPTLKRAPQVKPKQISKAKPKLASEAKSNQTSEAKPKQTAVAKPKQAAEGKPKNVATEVSERQTAVLKALRSMMDKKHRVEVRGAELAKASSIPLGSLHSVLASLEKKQMIRTERQGSAQFRAVYEILETARKGTRSMNGTAHGKEAH